mmetsp:Transcript_25875/g.57985  ORF Transcript_25875/g.57985 Transcript_25875/m.57985 type:complete len:216 (+) Transcript_25875:191-838(+)
MTLTSAEGVTELKSCGVMMMNCRWRFSRPTWISSLRASSRDGASINTSNSSITLNGHSRHPPSAVKRQSVTQLRSPPESCLQSPRPPLAPRNSSACLDEDDDEEAASGGLSADADPGVFPLARLFAGRPLGARSRGRPPPWAWLAATHSLSSWLRWSNCTSPVWPLRWRPESKRKVVSLAMACRKRFHLRSRTTMSPCTNAALRSTLTREASLAS